MTKPLDPIEAITATMPHDAPHPSHCENCGTALQGAYCHACGQHGHNPLRSFKHAVEDVFESFWHLDGRVFRSLVDLLVPGRIINNYLGGQRVRYIPPLRLYVILSLLTFFVAHFAAKDLGGTLNIDNKGNRYVALQSVDAVRTQSAQDLAELDAAMKELTAASDNPMAQTMGVPGLKVSREAIERARDRRIAELEGRAPPTDAASATVHDNASPAVQVQVGKPVAAGENSWWARKQRQLQTNAEENVRRFAKERGAFVESAITHAPTTLLVLVPVFALVLRLVYLMRRTGYLEHLVVALYSHAMLLLFALVVMLAMLARHYLGVPTSVVSVVGSLVWLASVLYLFLTQKRVYHRHWGMALLAFFVTGTIYSVLASFALAAVMALTLVGASH